MAVGNAIFAIVYVFFVNVLVYTLNENSVFSRWIKHRGALTITNRRAAVDPAKRPDHFFAWDLVDPTHVIKGYNDNQLLVLIYREFILAFFLFTLLYQGVWGSKLGNVWVIYFTNWDFVGLGLYSIIAIIVSCTAFYRKGMPSPIWEFMEKALVIVYVTVASNAIFLTAFYWMVIYDGETPEADNIFRHGINVVILLVELVLSRIPIVSYHLQVPFAFATVYAVFMWIYRGASGDWVYEAMDWSKTSSIFYYIVLPILIVLAFYLLYLVAYLREKFGKKSRTPFQQIKTGEDIELTETV